MLLIFLTKNLKLYSRKEKLIWNRLVRATILWDYLSRSAQVLSAFNVSFKCSRMLFYLDSVFVYNFFLSFSFLLTFDFVVLPEFGFFRLARFFFCKLYALPFLNTFFLLLSYFSLILIMNSNSDTLSGTRLAVDHRHWNGGIGDIMCCALISVSRS